MPTQELEPAAKATKEAAPTHRSTAGPAGSAARGSSAAAGRAPEVGFGQVGHGVGECGGA
jgi:hypothetical protein